MILSSGCGEIAVFFCATLLCVFAIAAKPMQTAISQEPRKGCSRMMLRCTHECSETLRNCDPVGLQRLRTIQTLLHLQAVIIELQVAMRRHFADLLQDGTGDLCAFERSVGQCDVKSKPRCGHMVTLV
jgi:hypothetical protein